MATGEPKIRRWTRREYYRLADLGFFDRQRVELVWGRLIRMSAMHNAHAISVTLTEDAQRAAFGPGYWIRVQMPLNLTKTSAPEPDVAVVRGSPRDYLDHPETALLVAEISETTLRFDRRGKAALYAAAGIQDYWIVNLVDRQVEVYRDPQPNTTRPRRSRYGQQLILAAGESISPLAMPLQQIRVDDLLP